MAQLAITIAGKVYRVACDEGEEARLGDLAQLVDAKISGMRTRFGEIGDQRLTIMAALTLADEWSEANDRVRELEAELARLKGHTTAAPEWAEKVAVSLGEVAQRIERVAQELNDSSRE
ncbi:MAG TPA: cell division protein ZapA [Methylocella sp.]|jgi:cell division protein ZapA|nr:cell division protein ZapA [Methylocella sp.]